LHACRSTLEDPQKNKAKQPLQEDTTA
jgi:hypothetical protein